MDVHPQFASFWCETSCVAKTFAPLVLCVAIKLVYDPVLRHVQFIVKAQSMDMNAQLKAAMCEC